MVLPPTILIALAMALPKIECALECGNTVPDNVFDDNPLEAVFKCVDKGLAKSLSTNSAISPADAQILLVDAEALTEVTHYQILTIKF